MIGKLTGKIDIVSTTYLLIDVNGVGYKVESAAPFRLGLEGADSVIFTYTHVRESELRLFGFSSMNELELFEKLLTVSGVGPKSAMLIVSTHSVGQIINAIKLEDPTSLRVKGVGGKTLAKLAIELKGKLDNIQYEAADGDAEVVNAKLKSTVSNDSELLNALVGLGFADSDIDDIIAEVDTTKPFAEQIKQSLKLLYGN